MKGLVINGKTKKTTAENIFYMDCPINNYSGGDYHNDCNTAYAAFTPFV